MNIITFFSILSPKHKSFYLILIFFSLITVFLEVLSIALVIPFISLILAPDKTIELKNIEIMIEKLTAKNNKENNYSPLHFFY